jgi:hypothetical protein
MQQNKKNDEIKVLNENQLNFISLGRFDEMSMGKSPKHFAR